MSKIVKKQNKDTATTEEQTQDTELSEEQSLVSEEEKTPALITAKQFVKMLKEEPKNQVSENIYIAFMASVPPVDHEKNYRLIWTSTFKRQ